MSSEIEETLFGRIQRTLGASQALRGELKRYQEDRQETERKVLERLGVRNVLEAVAEITQEPIPINPEEERSKWNEAVTSLYQQGKYTQGTMRLALLEIMKTVVNRRKRQVVSSSIRNGLQTRTPLRVFSAAEGTIFGLEDAELDRTLGDRWASRSKHMAVGVDMGALGLQQPTVIFARAIASDQELRVQGTYMPLGDIAYGIARSEANLENPKYLAHIQGLAEARIYLGSEGRFKSYLNFIWDKLSRGKLVFSNFPALSSQEDVANAFHGFIQARGIITDEERPNLLNEPATLRLAFANGANSDIYEKFSNQVGSGEIWSSLT